MHGDTLRPKLSSPAGACMHADGSCSVTFMTINYPPANALVGTAALAEQTWRGVFKGCGPPRTVPCSLHDTRRLAVDSPCTARVSGHLFLLDYQTLTISWLVPNGRLALGR